MADFVGCCLRFVCFFNCSYSSIFSVAILLSFVRFAETFFLRLTIVSIILFYLIGFVLVVLIILVIVVTSLSVIVIVGLRRRCVVLRTRRTILSLLLFLQAFGAFLGRFRFGQIAIVLDFLGKLVVQLFLRGDKIGI